MGRLGKIYLSLFLTYFEIIALIVAKRVQRIPIYPLPRFFSCYHSSCFPRLPTHTHTHTHSLSPSYTLIFINHLRVNYRLDTHFTLKLLYISYNRTLFPLVTVQ